jgi:nitrate/TMAO reductase-like tetraheme cytochrome c subunit
MALFEKQITWIKENTFKAVLIGVGALGLFIFLNIELLHFSSSPPFCKGLCHTQTSEVNMWEMSSHGQRGADCVSCHFREGAINYLINKVLAMRDLMNTVTGNMGRPLHDHEHYGNPEHLEFITAEQLEEEKLMDDILLPQYVHYPEKDLGAGPSNFAEEDGKWKIQMERYSFLWNIVNENCKNCHSKRGNRGKISKYNIADFIIKDSLFDFKEVDKGKAKYKVGGRRPLGGSIAAHNFHIDRGIACIDCHQEVVHAPQEIMEEQYIRGGSRGIKGAVYPRMVICFRCHNNRRAPQDCLMCHEYQKNMNLGTNGKGVDQIANAMYPDEANCTDCHLEENNWKMKPQVCVDCHDDEAMIDTLADWQSSTVGALAELEAQLKEIESALDKANKEGRDITGAEELFNDAYYNYQMVWYDGSKGAHNVDFAEALINVSKEKLKLAADMLIMY